MSNSPAMKEQTKNWWESMNPSYDWEGLYKAFPNVDFGKVYESLPKELLEAKPEDLAVEDKNVR